MRKFKDNYVLPEEGVVRLPVILRILGIGKTTWYNGIRSGKYPKSIKPSIGTVAWRVEDIRALISKLGEQNER